VWNFQPIGNRIYINESMNICNNVTKELDEERIRDIESKTLLSFKEFRKAHSILCPECSNSLCSGGYFAAIAPEICQKHLSKEL